MAAFVNRSTEYEKIVPMKLVHTRKNGTVADVTEDMA